MTAAPDRPEAGAAERGQPASVAPDGGVYGSGAGAGGGGTPEDIDSDSASGGGRDEQPHVRGAPDAGGDAPSHGGR